MWPCLEGYVSELRPSRWHGFVIVRFLEPLVDSQVSLDEGKLDRLALCFRSLLVAATSSAPSVHVFFGPLQRRHGCER